MCSDVCLPASFLVPTVQKTGKWDSDQLWGWWPNFAPLIEHLFFQVKVALSAFTGLINFQNGHTYGKFCLSWVSWLSEQSADVEIDDVTIVLCLPFQMLSGDNTEHRRVNWGHTVEANLVMDAGENKFVMERHLLRGWWWSFQEKK